MKKNILIILVIIFLTGCTSQYNIKIDGDKIEETVVSSIKKDEIPVKTDINIKYGIEVDDPITPFINNDQYPFFNNKTIIYDKSVKTDDDTYIVKLKHKYSFDEFKNSKAYNCFENSSVLSRGGSYYLSFSGSFYCMHGDNLTINISTKDSVLDHNADKVSGNTYSWVVNKDNANNLKIKLSCNKHHSIFGNSKNYFISSNGNIAILLFVIGLVVLLVFVGVFIIIRKNRLNNGL